VRQDPRRNSCLVPICNQLEAWLTACYTPRVRTRWHVCVSAGLLEALLAGSSSVRSAPEPTPTPASEPPAEVTVQTDEPRFAAPTRRDRIGRIWAPVMINGKGPFRLVLDTGASHSAVTPATAQLLGAPVNQAAATVTGFTGSAVVSSISASSMEVGDLLIGPTRLPVLPDVFGGAQGVLGGEVLADKRIVADFGHDRLVIARSKKEPAQSGFTVIRLKVIKGGLLIADAHVGGVPCKVLIDTGAQLSVGNEALRTALMSHPRSKEETDIKGVTLDVQRGDYVSAPEIQLGDLRIRGVSIVFGDMFLFQHWKLTAQPVLLLGMDLLGSFRVLIIDYRERQMQVSLRG
jgi:predicted aspartyl protease